MGHESATRRTSSASSIPSDIYRRTCMMKGDATQNCLGKGCFKAARQSLKGCHQVVSLIQSDGRDLVNWHCVTDQDSSGLTPLAITAEEKSAMTAYGSFYCQCDDCIRKSNYPTCDAKIFQRYVPQSEASEWLTQR